MAFSFFKKILGPQRQLGIDIGTTSLKIVEMERGKDGRPFLKNYAYLESFDYLDRSNAAFQTSTLRLDEEVIAKYLRALLKQAGIEDAPVVASLPPFSSFTTLIEVPAISDAELKNALSLQAQQYIPIPLSEVTLDWTKVGERVDEGGVKKIQVFLIAVPNDAVGRAKKIFELAGLKLAGLEIEGVAMARSLAIDAREPVLIIDIGSRSTGLLVAASGFARFLNQTDFAGGSLTQIIANGLNLAPRRAEDLKKQRGLTSGGEYELSTLIQPLLDVIINEGARVRNNYETTYKSKVTKVILAGGGANMPGLERYVSREMNLPAVKAQPFSSLSYPEAMAPLISDLGPLLSVAIGLGLKDL